MMNRSARIKAWENLGLHLLPVPGCITKIEKTNGTEWAISAFDTFSKIDPLFSLLAARNICEPKPKTEFQFYEATNAHTLTSIFGALTENGISDVCVTLSQIVKFAELNARWITDKDIPLCFIFKHGETYSVASIYANPLSPSQMGIILFKLDSNEPVWPGKCRHMFVVPKR